MLDANRLVFAVMAGSKTTGIEALMLSRSIRKFGGYLSNRPIWVLIPGAEDRLPRRIREDLTALEVGLIPFDIDEDALQLPFATKVFASAVAESEAQGNAELLAWMDPDTLASSSSSLIVIALINVPPSV